MFPLIFVIGFVESENEIVPAAERDERERQHQRRIEEKRETVAVGSEQMPETGEF